MLSAPPSALTVPAAAAACLLLLLLLQSPAAVLGQQSMVPASLPNEAGAYVVVLNKAPAATYGGDLSGYEATEVQAASISSDSTTVKKLDVSSATVMAYAAFLEEQSVSVAAAASVAAEDVLYKYKYVAAGFAARVTSGEQLAALRRDPRVSMVVRAQQVHAHTFTTPGFLGLEGNSSTDHNDGTGGVWDQLGGIKRAGEDVSICVLDSGIEPEHPSFSDRQDTSSDTGPYAYTASTNAGYSGNCPVGEEFPAGTCNRKLIGCQAFSKGYVAAQGSMPEGDVKSCRDGDSHGTHVSATASGNRVDVNGDGKILISGMAPKARLAMYKVLWGSPASGYNIDIVAALEKAIADGCDVINMSLGGSVVTLVDVYSLAIMQAAAAGIAVVMSAGNRGPNPSTVDNPFPYATIVAASTHSRKIVATVLADGKRYVGGGFYATTVGPARLILGNAAAMPGVKGEDAQKCFNGTLDPRKVAGAIVVCDRGVNARADKATEVKRAGGIGMVLVNVDADSDTIVELLDVPHVHLKAELRDDLRKYAATPQATAQLLPSITNNNARAPQMAEFSSRGPANVVKGAFLTPDITAPGVDIYAPVSKNKTSKSYNFYSGTSMAAPHVAGLAALIRQRYPMWSPMALKSALMTTAYQETKTGQPGLPFCKPFDCGAGHVDPLQMLNPGLVFDSSFEDWAKSLCTSTNEIEMPQNMYTRYCQSCPPASPPGQPDPCDAANLNLPSIALPTLAEGVVKVLYRTVTNVLDTTASFYGTASIDPLFGKLLKVAITPASFTLAPKASQLLRIEVVAQSGAIDDGWMYGSINWRSNQGTNTRIPLAAKVALLQAPAEVSPTIASVKKGLGFAYTINPGVSGRLQLKHSGLAPALLVVGTISNNQCAGVNLTIPNNTSYARFSVYQADFKGPGNTPLRFRQLVGLYVYDVNNTYIGSSESMLPNQHVSVTTPTRNIYQVFVCGTNVVDNVGFYINAWIIKSTPSRNLRYRKTVPVTPGTKALVGLHISKDLNFTSIVNGGGPPKRYLGRIVPWYGKLEGDATVVSIVA